MGEYCALKSAIDCEVETLPWSVWKAEEEDMSSAGIGSWKLGKRVSLEGVNGIIVVSDATGSVVFLDLGAREGEGAGNSPSAIWKFLSSLMS